MLHVILALFVQLIQMSVCVYILQLMLALTDISPVACLLLRVTTLVTWLNPRFNITSTFMSTVGSGLFCSHQKSNDSRRTCSVCHARSSLSRLLITSSPCFCSCVKLISLLKILLPLFTSFRHFVCFEFNPPQKSPFTLQRERQLIHLKTIISQEHLSWKLSAKYFFTHPKYFFQP